MKTTDFIIYALGSCALFIWIFVFVIHKPITIGIKQEYFAKKTHYLQGIEANKMVILAGSNGRFSHRCETLAQETGIPCANMSIAAGISLEYQFNKLKPHLQSGALVY